MPSIGFCFFSPTSTSYVQVCPPSSVVRCGELEADLLLTSDVNDDDGLLLADPPRAGILRLSDHHARPGLPGLGWTT